MNQIADGSALFEENLRWLKTFDPVLAAELEHGEGEPVAVHPAKVDGWFASSGSRAFHDDADPQVEAKSMVGEDPHQVHLHFGFGLGYYLAVDRPVTGGVVLIYEPNPQLILAAMRIRLLEPLFTAFNTYLCCRLDRMRYLYHKHAVASTRLFISGWHARAFRSELVEFRQMVQATSGGEARLSPLTQMYPHVLRSSIRSLKYNTRLPDCEDWRGRLEGKPAVLVCPGPSLMKNLAELTKYRDRVVVFALARVVSVLTWMGIEPDFVVHVESKDYIGFLEKAKRMSNTDFLLADQAEPKYYQHHHRQTYVYHSRTNPVTNYVTSFYPEMRKFHIRTGGSVATAAFHLAVTFGCNPIVLIGQDLAHTRKRLYYGAVSSEARVRRYVPGYFGGRETTSPNYYQNMVWYQSAVEGLKSRDPQRVFINATEGGADIGGFQKMKFAHAAHLYFKEPVTVNRPASEPQLMPSDILADVLVTLLKNLRFLRDQLDDFEVCEQQMLMSLARGEENAFDPSPVLRQYLKAFREHPPLLHLFPKETALCRTLTEELNNSPHKFATVWTDLAAIYRNTLETIREIEPALAAETAELSKRENAASS